MKVKLLLTKFIKTPEVLFILLIAIIEFIHIQMLFGSAEFLAGGDNYLYLQLGKQIPNFYIWDLSIPLGGRSYAIANLFSFLLLPVPQRLLIFCLYFFKYISFIKLARLFSKKFSAFALLPAMFLFVFNAFESLNPFSLFPLMYGVYLPFSLYYFIKLFESKKINLLTISKLIVLSVVFSSLNSNLPLSVTIFIPQIIYILTFVKQINKINIANLVIYYGILLVSSLWWLFPLVQYYFGTSSGVLSTSWHDFTNQGSFFLNLRFLGQWAWYNRHYLYPYYPFSSYYDKPLVVVGTYLIIFLAFFTSVIKSRSKDKRVFFILILALVSLFLIGGSRPPFGFIYAFLYQNVPMFRVFREPFTKFGELYVLSISLLFYIFLLSIKERIKVKWQPLVFIFFLFLVILGAKPLLLGEHVWDKWNGSMRSFRIRVPEYWKEFEEYQKNNLKDARILAVPKVYYGSAWSWPYGFSSADDVAVNFVSNGNSILRRPLDTGSISGEVVDNIYNVKDLPMNYFSLLGVDYILRENDLDWRYSGELTLSPSKNDVFVESLKLKKVAEFGKFTSEYLKKVTNDESDPKLRNSLYEELYDRPALELFKVKDEYLVPKFFVPETLIYANAKVKEFPHILKFSNYPSKLGIFLSDSEKKLSLKGLEFTDIYSFGKRQVASQTRYLVKVPKSGQYNVYIEEGELERIGYPKIVPIIEGVDVISTSDFIASWYGAGVANFNENKSYEVTLKIPKQDNLFGSTEPWFQGKYEEGNDVSSLMKSLFNVAGGVMYYKEIKDIRSGVLYGLSFDYVVESGAFGVAVVGTSSYGAQVLLTKELSGSGNYYNEFKSTNVVEEVYLFIYDYPLESGLPSDVKIENFEVKNVIEPLLVFKSVGDDKQETLVDGQVPKISFNKVNPTKYTLEITNAVEPYNLIFNETFDKNWKLYFGGKKEIASDRHVMINGYANAWFIKPTDTDNQPDYTLIVEYTSQRLFYFLLVVCVILFIGASVFLLWYVYVKIKKLQLT